MKILGTTERRTCEIAVKELNLPCTVDEFHRQFVLSCLKNLKDVYFLQGIAGNFVETFRCFGAKLIKIFTKP